MDARRRSGILFLAHAATTIFAALLATSCGGASGGGAAPPVPQLRPEPSPTAGSSAPLDHWVIPTPSADGVYVGVWPAGLQATLSSVQQANHNRLSVEISYQGLQSASGLSTDPLVHAAMQSGMTVLVNIGCDGLPGGSGNTFAKIAAGDNDTEIDADATALNALASQYPNMSIFLNLTHEFNLDIGNPSGNPNDNDCFSRSTTDASSISADAAEYVAYYQHFVQRFYADGVRNATWVWCPEMSPNTQAAAYKSPQILDQFYPGSTYVDWICVDGYDKPNSGYPNGGGFSYVFGASNPNADPAAFLASFGKPAMIGETGEVNASGPPQGYAVSQAAYLSEMQSAVSPGGFLYPFVKAVLYFDKDNTAYSGYNWSFDSGGMSEFAALSSAVGAPVGAPYWGD
jgi:hypothetical protein